jgi:hypothetical protein
LDLEIDEVTTGASLSTGTGLLLFVAQGSHDSMS